MISSAVKAASKHTCYYDGQCGLCTRSVRTLRKLDWFNRLDYVDMLSVPPEQLPVPMEAAMQGMPMKTRSGRVHVGYPAVRRALLATPLGCLPAMLMYVPGLSAIGRVAYRYIARNRRAVCSLPSTK